VVITRSIALGNRSRNNAHYDLKLRFKQLTRTPALTTPPEMVFQPRVYCTEPAALAFESLIELCGITSLLHGNDVTCTKQQRCAAVNGPVFDTGDVTQWHDEMPSTAVSTMSFPVQPCCVVDLVSYVP